MRSAIFDKNPLSFSEPRRQSRPRPVLKNSSPNVSTTNLPIINQKSKPESPFTGNYSKFSNSDSKSSVINGTGLSWNLDDMVNSYQEHRILPPILSPTIPQGLSSKAEGKTTNKEELTNDSISEITNENLPISMLSPTLPGMFENSRNESATNSIYSKLLQPKPKQAKPKNMSKLVDMSINQSQPSRVKVRWIDKSQDIHPKFLLRINFSHKSKYREHSTDTKAVSAKKYNGLGITSLNNDHIPSTRHVQTQVYKEPNQQTKTKKVHDVKESSQTHEEDNIKRNEKTLKLQGDKVHKQHRKAEQLKQLNCDILQTEKAQLSDLERIRVQKSESPLLLNQIKLSFTEKEREEFKTNLILKKNYWIKIAKLTRAESDKTKDPILSIAISMDAILVYMIFCDYDEKLKLIAELLPLERYWNSLYQDCSNLIIQIKQQIPIKDSNENSLNSERSPLKEYMQFFIGLLYQTKAIILKRANSVFQKVIDLYIIKKKDNRQNDLIDELNNKILELQQSTIVNCNKSIANFAKAQSFLSMTSKISVTFPKTWHNKSPQLNPVQAYETSLVPGGDNYFLPIGIYTELREISGFMFSCLREFGELFLSIESNDGKLKSNYILQSGLKGAPNDEFVMTES